MAPTLPAGSTTRTSGPRWGLGLAYCRKRPEVDRLIQAEVDPVATHEEAGAKGGRGNKASNIVKSFRGNHSTYALKRLKRDRPDLFRKVVDGLFGNGAFVAVGLFIARITRL